MGRLTRILIGMISVIAASIGVATLSGPQALAGPVTTVHVAGEATGFLPAPCNCVVGIHLAANASGSPTSLAGQGMNHATTGSTNHFGLTGSTDGSDVVLSGNVDTSTASFLVGSPVTIAADVATGTFTFTLGPIAGGPFAGQTLVFVGSGTVRITN